MEWEGARESAPGRRARAAGPARDPVLDPRDPKGVLEAVAPKILRVCRSVLGPHAADLDDAVQESLVALLHALPAWRGEGSLSHYACRIAVRVASRIREKARTRGTVVAAAAAEHSATAEGRASQRASAELGAALRDVLAELPPAQAETLILRFVLDYSPSEIAAAMGVPVNTVRSRVRLGRTLMLERIGGDPRLNELLGGDR